MLYRAYVPIIHAQIDPLSALDVLVPVEIRTSPEANYNVRLPFRQAHADVDALSVHSRI